MTKLIMVLATFAFMALALLSGAMISSESSCYFTGMTPSEDTFLTRIKIADASDDAADDKEDKKDDPEQIRLWDSVLLG